MRQSGILMVDTVVRLVQQSVGKDTSKPALRHNAPGGTVYRVAGQADVLDVFAPALQIRRDDRRRQIHPKEIFPQAEESDGRDQESPEDSGETQFFPNSPPHLAAPDDGIATDKVPKEKERRVKQAERKFEQGRTASRPTRNLRENKWPELGVAFPGKMDVMHLMHRAIKAEGNKAEHADKHAVEFIQPSAFPKQAVRSLVKTNQDPVHEMSCDQDQRQCEPDPAERDCGTKRDLAESGGEDKSLKCHTADLMLVAHVGDSWGSCCEVHDFNSLGQQSASPADNSYFLQRTGTSALVPQFQVWKKGSRETTRQLRACPLVR